MLGELRVRELGVIVDLEVLFGPGLTAITGETGAGKTLIVEALELVLGGKAEPTIVRSGADEATVEARFLEGEREIVVGRTVAREGRSRAFIDGRMASLAALGELGIDLVDLYGQHVHQSLLRPATQRAALDSFAGVDLDPVRSLRGQIAAIGRELDAIGGDEQSQAREIDFLTYELNEIERVGISGPDEERQLSEEEELLANAQSLREAAFSACSALEGDRDRGALDHLGVAIEALGKHEALDPHGARLRSLLAELEDATHELRRAAETFEEDPNRLASIVERRQLLRSLARKHGGDLQAVLDAAARAQARLTELALSNESRAALESKRAAHSAQLTEAEQRIGDQRRASAAQLSEQVGAHLAELALENARLEVRVDASGFGDGVEFLLSANPGEPPLPLAKVASGGELARGMLALRLLLSNAPSTLVFDEVDAGIGGAAAVSVGHALAKLGADHQVLVVTHLAQVAAAADHQLIVTKHEEQGRTVARLTEVTGEARVVELARMLSGHPDSESAQQHAAELLATAGRGRE